jgi:hypothetical protein
MYVFGGTESDIFEYDLSTAWDITSATYLQLYASPTGEIYGMQWNSDGSVLNVSSDTTNNFETFRTTRDANEDTGWLATNIAVSFTALTAEPDDLIVKLIPKTTSPRTGYPSINGVALYADRPA